MKLISITIILAFFSTSLISQNVSALEFVSPEQDQKDLIEAIVDYELSNCYTQTYLMEADKKTLQECFDNLLEYANIICIPPFGDMESEKCQIIEDYMRYLDSKMNPSVCETDPSRCAPPPRPVF